MIVRLGKAPPVLGVSWALKIHLVEDNLYKKSTKKFVTMCGHTAFDIDKWYNKLSNNQIKDLCPSCIKRLRMEYGSINLMDISITKRRSTKK